MNKQAFYEISKSKFYSYAFEISSMEEFQTYYEKIKLEHKKARHISYAYVFNENGVKEKYSDDKEPKGTAGLPILNVIKRKNLKNILIIVVRYFGGIKLGAGGLLRAYSKSASLLFQE